MRNVLFFASGLWASVHAVRTDEKSAAKTEDSGMAKVAELLAKIQQEKMEAMTAATTSYNEKVTVLDGQTTAARAALSRAENQQRDAAAIEATCNARIKQAQGQLDTYQVSLTKAELAAKTEKQLLDDARATWEGEAYELNQGLEAVRQVITTLDALQEAHPVNEPSLLQTPSNQTPSEKDMMKVIEAVASVVESVKINLASKQDLEAITSKKKAFLQQSAMPPLGAGKQGPQSNTGPLELGLENMQGISNILAKLRDMSHEIQSLIADGAHAIQDKSNTYELFKRQNELEIANLKSSIEATNKEMTAEQTKLQDALRTKDETELQKNTLNNLLNTYQQELKRLAAQQTETVQTIQAELTVLQEALKMIANTSFLQTGKKLEIKSTSLIQLAENLKTKGKVDPEIAAKVAKSLSTFAEKAHSTALSQLATKVESGISFARLIKMINQMVASLQQALKDLDSRERWCKTEMKNTFATFESWELKEKTLQLEWNVAAADMAAKRQLLAELADENTKAQEARVDLAKMRNDEKGDYEKKKVENQNYIEALQKVIASLATQFSSGPSASAAQSTIALLKEIENDLQREATEIEVAENTAITVYKETDADLMQAIALRDEMIKQTDRAVVALHGQQQDIQADLGDTKDALIAAAESKEAVEDGCQKTNEMTTEEKQAQLQSEIAALKDAMSILES